MAEYTSVMITSTVVTTMPLNVALHAGLARILRLRPDAEELSVETDCNVSVSTSQAVRIMAILREAVLNSIDYAHPAGVVGKLVLRSNRTPHGFIKIEVVDDGVGLPEGFDPTHDGGVGFETMRRSASELGGTLSFQSTCLGLAVRLIVPETPSSHGGAL